MIGPVSPGMSGSYAATISAYCCKPVPPCIEVAKLILIVHVHSSALGFVVLSGNHSTRFLNLYSFAEA